MSSSSIPTSIGLEASLAMSPSRPPWLSPQKESMFRPQTSISATKLCKRSLPGRTLSLP